MNETALNERVARVEGTHDLIIADLRRVRIFNRVAWAILAAIVIVIGLVAYRVIEVYVQQCGWLW